MSGPDPILALRLELDAAIGALSAGGKGRSGAAPTLERPPKPELGDYSTNASMLLAPVLDEPPREVAKRLGEALRERLGDAVEKVEVAGPGFLNLTLADAWYRDALGSVLAIGERFGEGSPRRPERALVEFVSANPTGPLTAASGRHAAYGDALARLLACAGHAVEREYYVNDHGSQVRNFAASLAARMTGGEVPEDGYEGEYVAELAQRLAVEGIGPEDLDALERRGVEEMVAAARATLGRFGVEFDRWFSERSLHEGDAIGAAIAQLEAAGRVYESEGAKWLRTSELGDDKDRVLIRSGGEPTYFAADIAYHRDKLERGYDRLIDVWGADHHGYVPRIQAACEALGADRERLEVLTMQLVHVVERGERAQMSKRKGEFVSLDELIADIGADAARWFLLHRSHDTTVDLDLALAREQSAENPVYYVQYAHARIASILRKAGEGSAPDDAPAAELHPSERTLIKRLLELPEEIQDSAARRAPHRLCTYAYATASDFTAFYRDCQVLDAPDGAAPFRLVLCEATKATLARTLALLGITAPERM